MLPRVNIEGRVVFEPELRFAPSGTAVMKVRLVASDRRKNDAGEWEDVRTLWLDTTAFGKTAENMAEDVEKGDVVIVTGKLSTDEWTTDDGEKKSKTVMILDTYSRMPRRDRGSGGDRRESSGSSSSSGEGEAWSAPTAGEDPPF